LVGTCRWRLASVVLFNASVPGSLADQDACVHDVTWQVDLFVQVGVEGYLALVNRLSGCCFLQEDQLCGLSEGKDLLYS